MSFSARRGTLRFNSSVLEDTQNSLRAYDSSPDNAGTAPCWIGQEIFDSLLPQLELEERKLSDQVQTPSYSSSSEREEEEKTEEKKEEEKKEEEKEEGKRQRRRATRVSKKGRTIEKAFLALKIWVLAQRLGKSPTVAAVDAGVPLKTMYDYFRLFELGNERGFNFDQNRRHGMGKLRAFLRGLGLLLWGRRRRSNSSIVGLASI